MKKEKKLLACIDVGNTNVKAGLFDGPRILKKFVFTADLIKKYAPRIKKVIIVSVSPRRLKDVLEALKKASKSCIPIYIVGKDVKVPLESLYNPREIGQDRLVTAYAAVKSHSSPVLIIDFGTAVTFDIVSDRNVYLGGLILPGIKMTIESLHNKTALLPEIELKKAKGFIGRATEDSIRNGIIYGYASMCDGLIAKFKKRFKRLNIVATGGDARLISGYMSSSMRVIDEDLSLKGLSLL